jgi:AraC-like DNA-binding protein
MGNTVSQLFSTDLLPPSDRIDAWQWNAQQICGNCRVRLPKASFHGSIEIRHVGGLPFTRFSSSALSFSKWPLDVATSPDRSCLVITQIAGARQYCQGNEEVLLRPGDSTLIDASFPWSSRCETDCVRLYLRVPRWMIEDRLRLRQIPIPLKIAGASAIGATLSRLAQALYEDAVLMEADEIAGALENYFETLASCARGYKLDSSAPLELKGRIWRFIDAHIGEASLRPSQIASAMGISLRHLHRVFSVSGNSVGDYIRTLRLEHCRKDLLNPQLRDRSITEIAFSRGFCDAAHFSHSFRKQYGISARLFRAREAKERNSDGSILSERSSPHHDDARLN